LAVTAIFARSLSITMDTTRCPLYRFPKKRKGSFPEEIEVVSRKMVNFFAAAWRVERRNSAKQMVAMNLDMNLEKQMVAMNLDMQNLKDDIDKVNEEKMEKLQKMEVDLQASLDCLRGLGQTTEMNAKAAMTLRDDQETLATNQVQVRDMFKRRLKELESVQGNFSEENAKLKGVLTTMMRTSANEIAKVRGEMAIMVTTIADGRKLNECVE